MDGGRGPPLLDTGPEYQQASASKQNNDILTAKRRVISTSRRLYHDIENTIALVRVPIPIRYVVVQAGDLRVAKNPSLRIKKDIGTGMRGGE